MPESDSQNSKIEQLKKSLYSPTHPPRPDKKSRLPAKEYDVKDDWSHPKPSTEENWSDENHYEEQESTFFKKILIGSLIFFVVAVALGLFIFFKGTNVVSADNVDISIVGPVSIAGGAPLSFDVNVHNKNNIKLELVDLSIDFPSGTASSDDTTTELKNFRQLMPDINPDGTSKKTVTAVLYGEENAKKTINIKVEYRVSGSNAVFYKEKTYDVFINSSPVNVDISSFTEVNSGQEFDLTATVSSNSKDVLKNLILRADYPFGFTFLKSDIKTAFDNNVWKLGDIPPGGSRVIKIHGKLEGQDEEERIFKFTVGTQGLKSEKAIGTQFLSSTQTIKIKKPFISVGLALNGDAGTTDAVGQNNSAMKADITWMNNLPTNVIDTEITVALGGNALNKGSVTVDKGFYRSSDNKIIWNKTTAGELANSAPGATGNVSFQFTPKVTTGLTNPTVSIDISIKSTRLSEDNVPEQIISTIHRVVKVASDIDLAGQVLRSSGPFVNSGLIPPKVDHPTTYTIVWTVLNTSSNIANAVVTAQLPTYVKWLGKTSPAGQNVTLDAPSNTITWKVGDLKAYTGLNGEERMLSFQIEFDPSLSQLGQTPVLVNDAKLMATDQFTGQVLTATKTALTTRFSTDPTYTSGDEQVKN